jgi:hypothetical protein
MTSQKGSRSKALTVPFPTVFTAKDVHPFLLKYKQSLGKRLSLTKMAELFCAPLLQGNVRCAR